MHLCERRNRRQLEAQLVRLEHQRAEIIECERIERQRLERIQVHQFKAMLFELLCTPGFLP